MSVTIRQVAAKAGVSYQTVSRLLNDSGPVSVAARGRIEEAMAELGYQPSSLARNLRRRQTGLLGFALSNILTYAVAAEYRAVLDAAEAAGYRVLTGNTDEDATREERVLAYFAASQVEGVLFNPASPRSGATARRLLRDIPVVVGRQLPGFDCVDADYQDGIRTATSLHVQNGHRRIALIAMSLEIASAQARLQGYREALELGGLSYDERSVAPAGVDMASGYRAAQALLRVDPPPTALVVANHYVTAAVMLALRDLALRVPQDVSVVTCSETPWAPLVKPPLTSISYDPLHLGRAEMELLVRRVRGDRGDEPLLTLIPMALRVRSSTAPPQAPPPAYDPLIDSHLEHAAAMYSMGGG